MYRNLTGILSICISSLYLQGHAQLLNFDKMSRTELREQVAIQLGKVDSLTREARKLNINLNQVNSEVQLLHDEINTLSDEKDEMKKTISTLLRQVQGLETTVREKGMQARREQIRSDSLAGLIAETEDKYNRMLEDARKKDKTTIDTLRNQLEAIRRSGSRKSSVSPQDDFLTRYLREPVPLNNTSLSFTFEKVLAGYRKPRQYEDPPADGRLPELIELDDLMVIRPQARALKTEVNPDQFLQQLEPRDINREFPVLEFTKNKLLTIRYPDDSEEALMFNFVREPSGNGRLAGRFAMVAERTDLSDEENTERDIEWEVYAIGNQAYLALTSKQLERIGITIRGYDNRFMVVDKDYDRVNFENVGNLNLSYYKERYFLAGKDHYIVRKQDPFMESAVFIDPDYCLFLFRLNRQEPAKPAVLKK